MRKQEGGREESGLGKRQRSRRRQKERRREGRIMEAKGFKRKGRAGARARAWGAVRRFVTELAELCALEALMDPTARGRDLGSRRDTRPGCCRKLLARDLSLIDETSIS